MPYTMKISMCMNRRKLGKDANEYVVYSFSGDIKEAFADDKVNVKSANVTVRYFLQRITFRKILHKTIC